MSPDFFSNMTASASTKFYSALDARIVGLVFVAMALTVIVVLASSRLFLRLKRSTRLLAKTFYYVVLGVPVVLGTRALYALGIMIGELAVIAEWEPLDIAKGLLWLVGLGVLGYLADNVAKRIVANLKPSFEETPLSTASEIQNADVEK